jgi:hypothetical protein
MSRWPQGRVAPGLSSASAWGVGSGQREGFCGSRICAREGLSRDRRRQTWRQKSTQLCLARQRNGRRHAPRSRHAWNGSAMRRRMQVRIAPCHDSAKAWGVGSREREGVSGGRISAREGLRRDWRRETRRQKSTQLGLARQGHGRWRASWSNHAWNGSAMRRWAEIRVAHHPDSANAWRIRRQRRRGGSAALQPGRLRSARFKLLAPPEICANISLARRVRYASSGREAGSPPPNPS